MTAHYEDIRRRCFAAAEAADQTPKLTDLADVMKPLAPYTPDAVMLEATRAPSAEERSPCLARSCRKPRHPNTWPS